MLHPINPAAEAELRNVLAFQRRVLEFALLPGLTVQQVPRGQNGNLVDRLTRAEVDTHFGANAAWFWSHTSLHQPVIALNAVVRNDAALRAQALAAFDNDVGFDNHTNDPAFTFACGALPDQVRAPLRALLENFYDLLTSEGGYANPITGNGILTRSIWVRAFWTLNSNLRVCPACDGAPPDEVENKISGQCDHHLPKSKHPTLSIHPRNLVPICTPCNLEFKNDADANDRARLSQMFLPYARHVFGPLQLRALRDTNGELAVQLDDAGATDTPGIQSLNHVFKLQERWSNRLRKDVSRSLGNKLRYEAKSAARRGEPSPDLLQEIAAQRAEVRSQFGSEPNAIIAEAYWTLLANDPNERNPFAR